LVWRSRKVEARQSTSSSVKSATSLARNAISAKHKAMA
jgi:hypothetical protein